MHFLENHEKSTITITLVLLMTFITIIAMPSNAQTTLPSGITPTNLQTGASIPLPSGVTPDETYNTLARIAFRPNPIGLSQPLLVNVWTEPPVHQSRYYTGLTVTLTKPDGTKVVVGPFDSFYADTTGWFEYPVDQIGTWKIKFDFPGGYFPRGNYTSQASATIATIYSFTSSSYYKPSSSPEETFVVQTDLIRSWPVSPLPTDYWTRPVSPENREWWPVSGNYPSTGVCGQPGSVGGVKRGTTGWPANTNTYMSNYNFIPYVQAPHTAHIVWKNQGVLAGLVGGTTGQSSLAGGQLGGGNVGTGAPGSALTGGGNPTIVYAGRAYQTYSKPGVGTTTQTYWKCYDIRTGQLYWERPLVTGESAPTVISYFFTPPTVTAGGIGVPGSEAREPIQLDVSLLSLGTRMIKYDPWTGAVLVNGITRLANNFTGMTGTFYKDPFVLSVQDLGAAAGANRYRLLNWTTSTVTDNFTSRVLNNITWPFSSLGTCDFESNIAVSTAGITPPGAGVAYGLRIMAASITSGQLLWNITTDPADYTLGSYSASTQCADHGKFAVRLNDGYWHCWDLFTGKELWKSDLSSYPWGVFGIYGVSSAYGLLHYSQFDGVVAYNWTTGKIAWQYVYTAQYPYETVYDTAYPFYEADIRIADGIMYASNAEHSPTQPLTRGWKLHAINATTGTGLWNITGGIAAGAVADGYLTASDGYDGYTYAFGKGKSTMTVTAPDIVVSNGTGILIKGTVMDMSPAQPNTPCVSGESMATQMEYLHMQHPIDGLDHNIQMTGVPVTLTAIDSNGNPANIGTAISNAYYGTFEMAWMPPAEGTYKIIASFAGDDSYGSSAASTAVSVGPAPSPVTFPQQPTPTDYTMTIVGVGIAVIIAVVIAAVAIILIGRKR